MSETYSRWATNADISLSLSLGMGNGEGAIEKSPEVSIRRDKETHGGSLDQYFWDGASFKETPTWFSMLEVDKANQPGLYQYLFQQSLIGLEWTYSVYYRHTVDPVGFASETHVITNEIYIPATQPDPVVVGPETIMGQLELVKGLLHHNSLLDNQVFEEGQLVSARLRMFDSPERIPASEGGSEVLGLLAEFHLESAYDETGLNSRYVLKRVIP